MADGVARAEQDHRLMRDGAEVRCTRRERGRAPSAARPSTARRRTRAIGSSLPDDAEVEAYLETALNAPAPDAHAATTGPSAGEPDPVVVLDFGSQFAQLIARRVRELHVYSELLPHDTPCAEIERRGTKAIILSGGPNSVYDEGAPKPDPAIWSRPDPGPRHLLRRPAHGPRARRRRARRREARVRPGHGHDHRRRRPVRRPRSRPAGLDEPRRLDHPPARGLQRRPPRPTRPPFAGLQAPDRNLYGIQFHPEVVHTPTRPRRPAQLRRRASPGVDADLDAGQLHRHDRGRDPRAGRRARRHDRLGRARSSAPCRAASTRPSRRRSSIGRSAIG